MPGEPLQPQPVVVVGRGWVVSRAGGSQPLLEEQSWAVVGTADGCPDAAVGWPHPCTSRAQVSDAGSGTRRR